MESSQRSWQHLPSLVGKELTTRHINAKKKQLPIWAYAWEDHDTYMCMLSWVGKGLMHRGKPLKNLDPRWLLHVHRWLGLVSMTTHCRLGTSNSSRGQVQGNTALNRGIMKSWEFRDRLTGTIWAQWACPYWRTNPILHSCQKAGSPRTRVGSTCNSLHSLCHCVALHSIFCGAWAFHREATTTLPVSMQV